MAAHRYRQSVFRRPTPPRDSRFFVARRCGMDQYHCTPRQCIHAIRVARTNYRVCLRRSALLRLCQYDKETFAPGRNKGLSSLQLFADFSAPVGNALRRYARCLTDRTAVAGIRPCPYRTYFQNGYTDRPGTYTGCHCPAYAEIWLYLLYNVCRRASGQPG